MNKGVKNQIFSSHFFAFEKSKKRGLSGIIMAIILIALVLIAAAIVWAIISNVLDEKEEQITNAPLAQNIKLQKVFVNSDGNLSVKVKRGFGPGPLDKIKVVIINGTDEQEELVLTSINENQVDTFIISLEVENPTKVFVYPVTSDGNKDYVGIKTDEISIGEEGEVVPEDPPEDPDTEPTGLMAYYGFEDSVLDTVGNYDGTAVGAIGFVNSKAGLGKAVEFDVDAERVLLPSNNPVWLPKDNFTISALVYFSDVASETDYILDMNHGDSGTTSNELGYALRRNADGKASFLITLETNSDEDLVSNTILTSGIWYHLVAVRDGTSQRLYIGGALDSSRTCDFSSVDFVGNYDNDEISIGGFTRGGASSFNFWFDGMIDEVRIYDRALTTEEIETITV
jgi:hypothetical protein